MNESHSPKEGRLSRSWFPNSPLGALRHEMNDLLENFFGETLPAWRSDQGLRVDVSETTDAVEVTTDLPGYQADDINIDVGENYLTISGHHEVEEKSEDAERKYHRVERRAGSFSRSVWLPCPVDDGKTEAHLADGVLTIHLPKQEATKRRKIPVKQSKPKSKEA